MRVTVHRYGVSPHDYEVDSLRVLREGPDPRGDLIATDRNGPRMLIIAADGFTAIEIDSSGAAEVVANASRN